MPVSMLVKCEKCGYENFPQHRFCGMCAAELRIPGAAAPRPAASPPLRVSAPAAPVEKEVEVRESVAARKEVVPREVSGPSFLGLGNDAAEARSVSYLLEDDSPSHRGRNLILLLLMAAVAAAAWYWRQDLRAEANRFFSSPPPAANSANGNPSQEPNSSGPSAADSTSGNQIEKPSAGAGPQADAQAPTAQTQTPAPPAAGETAAPGAAGSTQTPPADQSPPSNQSQPNDSAPPAAVPKPDDSEPGPPAPAPKSGKMRAPPAATSATRADDLEAEGEKYLYGNGVPENCTRARTNLLAAAQHSNAQAQNVLGTMYATGHCATRDLPTAYRWFSRSLRKDPSNSRIEQDLKVLWNQMTPGERQLALRGER
jgi:cytoskeletal protein RodZ